MNAGYSVDSVTRDLFSLSEPWRDRFLKLVAGRATKKAWVESTPTQEEIAAWLGDRDLCREIRLLLSAWAGFQK